ncbi:hypothetical protein ACFONC_03340 [Luteimonas soli]|uniref:Uncharacterized protein n=1 Tax=Luteimonas soli TaxID=1648966 RepID=A0ABV7XKA4_9GAMM
MLRAARSQYGDYFDFELLAAPTKGVGELLGARTIALVSGYACRTQLLVHGDEAQIDDAMLVVGNTTLFLPVEHGAALAAFLGIELQRR